MAYPLGQEVRLQGKFFDLNGNLADPSNVTLFVRAPGAPQGTSTSYTWTAASSAGTLVRASVGTYTYDLLLNHPGTWTYCWEGTGTVETATFDTPLVVSSSSLRTT